MALRIVPVAVLALGLVGCASDGDPAPGAEPSDTVTTDSTNESGTIGSETTEPTVSADESPTTTHEVERLPALDEDSAM